MLEKRRLGEILSGRRSDLYIVKIENIGVANDSTKMAVSRSEK